MAPSRYFITGTDTGCGKTYFTCEWLKRLKQQGKSAVGLKPIASGGVHTSEGLRNEDALALQAASTLKLPYESINPFCFELPISPHLAAAQAGSPLQLTEVVRTINHLSLDAADTVLVEGVGGVLCPLNDTQTCRDLMQALQIPVILVVGLKLGCLNHALLSMEALQQAGIPVAGWVANPIDSNQLFQQENIATLQRYWGAPFCFKKSPTQ